MEMEDKSRSSYLAPDGPFAGEYGVIIERVSTLGQEEGTSLDFQRGEEPG